MFEKIWIGIDPGVTTGIAIWCPEKDAFINVTSTRILRAMDICREFRQRCPDVRLRIEDARKRTWFGNSGPERWKGAGSVMRDVGIWEEFCRDEHFRYDLVHPKHVKTKTKADYFAAITGYRQTTNEHGRDAAMLVFKMT